MEGVEEHYSCNLILDLSSKRKKRKSKSRFNDETTISISTEISDIPKEESYSYEYLLNRVFRQIKHENPDLTGVPSKTKLTPPKVLREGTKKTVFANFIEFCVRVQRDPNHVMSFMLEELSASGSLDGTKRLVIRAKYTAAAIESVARKYIHQYVLCNECKGIDTMLDKDKTTRLLFLKCNKCFASQSVR